MGIRAIVTLVDGANGHSFFFSGSLGRKKMSSRLAAPSMVWAASCRRARN
jgi:hypothetical protein